MEMKKEFIDYYDGDMRFRGYAAYSPSKKRPAIIVCHPWMGQDDFTREKAEMIADLGCIGFAVDLYGEGRVARNEEEAGKLMNDLMNNRHLIRRRLHAAINAVKEIAYTHPNHIGAIGYCFGGACALELARSGANLRGVVSFHGLLHRDNSMPIETIPSSILAFHGYEDPLISKQDLQDFQEEMTKAGADWQLVVFGNTMHSFTNPNAQSKEKGMQFNKRSFDRSWRIMKRFFRERFEEDNSIPQPPIMA